MLLEVREMGQAFPMKYLPLSMTIRDGSPSIGAPRFGKRFAMGQSIGEPAATNPVARP